MIQTIDPALRDPVTTLFEVVHPGCPPSRQRLAP
jgi:hypothetical protein